MKTKTFKIGEYCIGGILKVVKSPDTVDIKAINWFSKEVVREEVFDLKDGGIWAINGYLHDLTSSYYADKVMQWIRK